MPTATPKVHASKAHAEWKKNQPPAKPAETAKVAEAPKVPPVRGNFRPGVHVQPVPMAQHPNPGPDRQDPYIEGAHLEHGKGKKPVKTAARCPKCNSGAVMMAGDTFVRCNQCQYQAPNV